MNLVVDTVRQPRHLRLVTLGLSILALLTTLFWLANRGEQWTLGSWTEQPKTTKPIVLAQTNSTFIAINPYTGTVVSQHPGSAALLAATANGQQVVAATDDALIVYRLPDWAVAYRLPLDNQLPNLHQLATYHPDLPRAKPRPVTLEVDPTGRYAAVGFVSMGEHPDPAFLDTPPWILWVTAIDLQQGAWLPWIHPLPGTDWIYIVPTPEKLFLAGSPIAATSQPLSPGTLFALDPTTGQVQGQLALPAVSPAHFSAAEGGRHPRVAAVRSFGDQLLVATEQLEVFVVDPGTLQVTRQVAPLSPTILVRGAQVWLTTERLVALTQTSELIQADLVSGQIVARRSLPTDWTAELVTFLPDEHVALLLLSNGLPGCLVRVPFQGEIEQLLCGLDTNLYERRFAVTGGIG